MNRRLRVGVDGGTRVVLVGRAGDSALRGEGGVTSVCSMELNIALACSVHISAFPRFE